MKKLIKGGMAVLADRVEKLDILIDGEKIAGLFAEGE